MTGTPTRSAPTPNDRHAHDCRTAPDVATAADVAQDAADPGCAAAILAGGRGRRLGGAHKGALVVGGRPIIEGQIALLRELTPAVVIVANEREPYAHLGVPIVRDVMAGAGPLAGLCAALEHSAPQPVLVVACDMPFLSLAFLRHLVRRLRGVDVALPRTGDGYHPLCAVYAQTARPAIRARLREGRLDVVGLVTEVRVAEIGPEELAPFDPERVMLSNVNTPQDLRQACAWADRE